MKIQNKIPHYTWYMWASISNTQMRPYKKVEKKKFCPKRVEPSNSTDEHPQRKNKLSIKV